MTSNSPVTDGQSLSPCPSTLSADRQTQIAAVFINQKYKGIDQVYDYRIPEDLPIRVEPGIRVQVSFGSENRIIEAFVVACKDKTDYPDQLKPILAVLDARPILTAEQIRLCLWMKTTYFSLFYDALNNFTLPVKLSKGVTLPFDIETVLEKRYVLTDAGRKASTKGKKMQQILALLGERACTAAEIRECLGNVSAGRRSLEKQGLIQSIIDDGETKANDFRLRLPMLNERAKVLVAQVRSRQHLKLPFSLCESDKVTRFQVYCHIAADQLRRGKQVVMCFSEVGMTLSLKTRFMQIFGNAGAIYHAKLKPGERRQIFSQVQKGSLRIIMGTRSALFLPYQDLGVIIIDQPGDATYAAQNMPYYSAVETARVYAEIQQCLMISGDAVPTMTDVAAEQTKKQIIVGKPIFSNGITAIEMQQEIKSGNFDFMSRALRSALEKTVAGGGRAALLLNLRQYASRVLCRACGHTMRCPDCDLPMQVTADQHLRCSYCGRTAAFPKRCPNCGDSQFRTLGLGIEQVHDILVRRYPDWRIIRIDGGTVKDAGGFEKMNAQIRGGDWDIVLGTQLLMKGFDYPEITLTGTLLADCDLHSDSYDAREKAYRLYSRFFALGQGQAFLQTYDRDDSVITALVHRDAQLFYRSESEYRRLFAYPPYGHLIFFNLSHAALEVATQDADRLYDALTQIPSGKVFKPTAMGLQHENKKYLVRLVVKTRRLAEFCRDYQAVEQQFYKERRQNAIHSNLSIALDNLGFRC